MRRFLIVLTIVVVAAAALLAGAALSLNRVIARNRDRIVHRAEAALGRAVSVRQITVSLWGGVGIRLEDVRIAADRGISDSDFARAAAVTAQIDFWPLLRGQAYATADVHDGTLAGFNVPAEVLGRATGLPGIGDLISARVKPKYARLFSEPTTRFEQLHASLRIANRRIQVDELVLAAADYGVRAHGWITLDRNADLSGTLLMSNQFSGDVAADVKEVKYMLDENGQLAVPFRLRGKIGEAKPEPDTRRLTEMLTRALTRGGAKRLLDQLLGGKRRVQRPPESGQPRDSLDDSVRDPFGR